MHLQLAISDILNLWSVFGRDGTQSVCLGFKEESYSVLIYEDDPITSYNIHPFPG